MTSDNVAINSTNFKVDKNGNMTCNNANVTGTITSSNATITGGKIKITGTYDSQELLRTENQNNQNEFSYLSPITLGLVGQNGRVDLNAKGADHFYTSSVEASDNNMGYSALHGNGEVVIYNRSVDARGKAMFGDDYNTNIYNCKWTGSSLQFLVNGTNVGTLSDKRLKTEIQQIDKDFINAINEIEMKQFKIANRNGLVSFGILAQDLIEIFEKYNKNPFDYEIVQETQYKKGDDTIYYTINYEQFLILKSKAEELQIIELQEEIEQLKEQIKVLEEK